MGKKILDSKVLYVVLSILLSVSAWLYITSLDATKESEPFRGLPVQLVGVDVLEERGLMVVNENLTADITVRARPLVLATLRSANPTLSASVSGITTEGEHTVAYNIELPEGVRSSEVEYVSTGNTSNTVKIEVARFIRRAVPVEGEFQGSVAENYLAGDKDDFRFSTPTVWVSGRAEYVNQVAAARVTVTGEELTETVSGEFAFQLIGASGDVLEGLEVSCDVDVIGVTFPVWATAEIPLRITLSPGGGLSAADVKLDMTTESIIVAGSQEAVGALTDQGAITLAVIELSSVRDGDELTYTIPLADELENLSGVAEVKVGVHVLKRVESRTFEVTNIGAINEPEGWQANIITKAVQVEIRGTAELLDELEAENIRVYADLRGINQATGQYSVAAQVYLDSAGSKSEIGEMNPGSYTIVVSLVQEG